MHEPPHAPGSGPGLARHLRPHLRWKPARPPRAGDAQIVSSLPRSWELEHGFHDALYEWMDRAPWMAVSAAAHLFVFFVLSSIPWNELSEERAPALEVVAALPPVDDFVEPVELPIDELEPVPLIDDLVVVTSETPVDVDSIPAPESFAVDAFDTTPANFDLPIVGVGGGPSSKYAGRLPGGRRPGSGAGSEAAVRAGLAWLVAHQNPDGSWSGARFAERCGSIGATVCDGAGSAAHDVGLTALALLALLGDGHSTDRGRYRAEVARGIAWLRSEQDPDTGLIGASASHDYAYDHAIATLALCEAYYFSRSPLIKREARSAVNVILRGRNPYGAWRYALPGVGDNDTSVTGWMVFALASAKDAGLGLDPDELERAFEGALAWIDEVTDPVTGRVGYDGPRSLSSRTPGNRSFPREKGEAMTAVGVLSRIFLGQTPESAPAIVRGAELLRARPPLWEPEARGCDMYYWYCGTYAMYQLGGAEWRAWNRAMKAAIVDTQHTRGDSAGSWDPVGPWGSVGGRVYATALMTLSLEVYYRYNRVLGGR